MNKQIYIICILIGLGIFIYFYMFNFDSMSETELVNNVLYWYVPLIFGIFGLTALHLNKTADPDLSPLKYFLSGKDTGMTVFAIIVFVFSALIGILLFFIPLIIYKVQTPNYDFKVAITGAFIWLAGLWGFFVVLWPSL